MSEVLFVQKSDGIKLKISEVNSMEINYFNLSGGINQSSTKTELGANTKLLYWTDAENIEILNNKGIVKQKGNQLFIELPVSEKITGMKEMESEGRYKLVITTESGKIYVYNDASGQLTLLEKTLAGTNIQFVNFMRGMLIASESDKMFYLKDNETFDIEDCNLTDLEGQAICPDTIAIYKGRVWCAKGSTIYYSALGTYNDFITQDDAGYINDFHTDTADIIAMNTYKDYLAIYKKERVYLLSGSNPEDFAITLFADKGATNRNTILNVDNKQYFLSNGIFALEQVGELNQIRLGSEISRNIKGEFEKFSIANLSKSFALHYTQKHQMWYFFPYSESNYMNTIWINDYVNYSWYKRVLPQHTICAANFKSNILTADDEGKIYLEDFGSTFNGEAIKFLWKSPFLALSDIHHKKIIDEFYFILDDEYNNNFKFSVYKDYDSHYEDDREAIYSITPNQLVWADDESPDAITYQWSTENHDAPVWSITSDVLEKAEIYGSCYSVQLCVQGSDISENCAIIGLQFREIYNDD